MRKLLMAATVLSFAAPAAAQLGQAPSLPDEAVTHDGSRRAPDRGEDRIDPRDEDIVRAIPRRGEIEAVGDVAARAADAILATPVGPLREAIEGRRLSRRERAETLGDRASRDDPYFRERMRDQIAVASVAIGALAEQMAVMTPVLRRTLEDTQRRVEDAVRGVPPPGPDGDYDDRDHDLDDPREDEQEYTPIEDGRPR